MGITPAEFAAALPALRPGLLQFAARNRPCSIENAEDLVSEAVMTGLVILEKFDDTEASEPREVLLRRWMTGILRFVLLEHSKRVSRRLQTAPIEEAEQTPLRAPAPGVVHGVQQELRSQVDALPDKYQTIVEDWLDGYTQSQIARRHSPWHEDEEKREDLRMHRNTVANRLKQAFKILRLSCPDEDRLAYSTGLFDFCATVTTYQKPTAVWRSWYRNHPPEQHVRPRPLRIRRRSIRRKVDNS